MNKKEGEDVRTLTIIVQVIILFIVYFIGVYIQQLFNLIIPGSVIGLMLMFLLLLCKIVKAKWIKSGANFMIANLAMFFIPATVGFLNYYELFIGKGLLLILTTIASTITVIVISGHVSQFVAQKRGKYYE